MSEVAGVGADGAKAARNCESKMSLVVAEADGAASRWREAKRRRVAAGMSASAWRAWAARCRASWAVLEGGGETKLPRCLYLLVVRSAQRNMCRQETGARAQRYRTGKGGDEQRQDGATARRSSEAASPVPVMVPPGVPSCRNVFHEGGLCATPSLPIRNQVQARRTEEVRPVSVL